MRHRHCVTTASALLTPDQRAPQDNEWVQPMRPVIVTAPSAYHEERPRRLRLFAPSARPVRFVAAGCAAAAVQVMILRLLIANREPPEWSNVIAVFCGIQASFAFSSLFTWRD
jgi:hypothetical protein